MQGAESEQNPRFCSENGKKALVLNKKRLFVQNQHPGP
jgi:hypothetical protein